MFQGCGRIMVYCGAFCAALRSIGKEVREVRFRFLKNAQTWLVKRQLLATGWYQLIGISLDNVMQKLEQSYYTSPTLTPSRFLLCWCHLKGIE